MTTSEPNGRAAAPDERHAVTDDVSWMLWTAIGIGSIWVNVLLISLFAPDLVTGSEQEHLPLAALTTWFWGAVGTLIALWAMSRLRGNTMWQPIWIGLSAVTLVLWTVAMILAIALPVFETGTDPTQLPFGALFAPIVAALLTGLAGGVSIVFRQGLRSRP